MEAAAAAAALARTSASLVGEIDPAGLLAALLTSCVDVLPVAAGGILVDDRGRLDVLAASSHTASELELHQAHLGEGPCVEAHASGSPVSARGFELTERWPDFGRTMLGAGFHSVHASPLRWHGERIGAMALFRQSPDGFTAEEQTIAQAFADLATVLVVQAAQIDLETLRRRIHDLLHTRVVIEQAKGVLSETEHVDMGEAYQSLLRRAAANGHSLTAAARFVVDAAQGTVT